MIELTLLLLAMTSNQTEAPAVEAGRPAAVSHEAKRDKPLRELNDEERAELRKAVERIARCSTGKLRFDPASGFYVPETKPDCK